MPSPPTLRCVEEGTILFSVYVKVTYLGMYVDFKPGVRKGFAGLEHVTSNGCPGQLARSTAIVPGLTI